MNFVRSRTASAVAMQFQSGGRISAELDMVCPAVPSASGRLRTMMRSRLRAWGQTHLAHDLCLVAAELIANAIEAAPRTEIRIRLTPEPEAVLLEVWDSSARSPVARPVVALSMADITPDAEALNPGHDDGSGGWGLPIVEALSSACGIRPTEPNGKWVWARLTGCSDFSRA
ncbi:ATP-binding protein [Spirillospora sp. CA-294931]|uniref:ATP-binding protein n=1 Tax=Spirillospora sp. CA-294931 TaxID=3240042 RepID=UPI003D89EF3B